MARGGAGGRGNKSFPALAGRPAPDTSEPGQPGAVIVRELNTVHAACMGTRVMIKRGRCHKHDWVRRTQHAPQRDDRHPRR